MGEDNTSRMRGRDARRPRRATTLRLLLMVLGLVVLVLPATVALAANDRAGDDAAPSAAAADGQDHCDDSDNPGHKDCRPENNPRPEEPPCDADHGHPGENAKPCQDDGGEPDPCEGAGGDADGDGVCGDVDNCPDTANEGQADADGDGVGDACDTEGPPGDPSCEDGVDNDGDGDVDGDDEDCDDGGGGPCEGVGDADGDGVCDDVDNCPDTANEDQADADGDGVGDACDDDENLCTAAAEDPGLPLTEDTLGQTLWDSGLDALSPLTEDPERNGALSGAIGDGGTGTPLEPVTDEAACAVDLLIDEELGGDL